jgi:hypothetical protein
MHAIVTKAGIGLVVSTLCALDQFADYNLLKGSFANSDMQITVDQLEPARGPCNRR